MAGTIIFSLFVRIGFGDFALKYGVMNWVLLAFLIIFSIKKLILSSMHFSHLGFGFLFLADKISSLPLAVLFSLSLCV